MMNLLILLPSSMGSQMNGFNNLYYKKENQVEKNTHQSCLLRSRSSEHPLSLASYPAMGVTPCDMTADLANQDVRDKDGRLMVTAK
ncbi:hypothetical protein EJB05_36946 [Eragrostis curvula]|uniref:Uncharacterized protein n=1 Tax=Eragrostis curvula TaxID=38414 RepID=A0A5J9U1A0_9POAL|nr:hypothetical protein EJB05_36946 [Eragrostis curvula]